MPGLLEEKSKTAKNAHKRIACKCQSRVCQHTESKRGPLFRKEVPPNAVVFQLSRYREPKSDTYSHTVYKKEMCSRRLMNQHAALAQKKAPNRAKQTPILEQERFACKTTTDSKHRRYTLAEAAACKAKFPRTKMKEDFYFKPGEYSCNVNFKASLKPHDDYSPKLPFPSSCRKGERQCEVPTFEGRSCYDRDFRAPPVDAYLTNRKGRKKVVFD